MDLFSLKREHVPVIVAVVIIVAVVAAYYFSTAGVYKIDTQKGSVTEEDKLRILQQLQEAGTASSSVADKKRVLNDLSNSKTDQYQYSEQGKLQILQSLQNQGTK